jgi:hypothetical protein
MKMPPLRITTTVEIGESPKEQEGFFKKNWHKLALVAITAVPTIVAIFKG